MKKFRWPLAILSFLLALAVFAGGIHLRQRQMVNEPLLKRLSELESVEKVELTRDGGDLTVSVKLEAVDDLSFVHRKIQEEISRLLGRKSYRLIIQDERDDTLEAAFIAVHLALYEGRQRGNFSEMGDRVSTILQGFGLSRHKVLVDGENIYFQVESGDKYLYAIISLENRAEEGSRT